MFRPNDFASVLATIGATVLVGAFLSVFFLVANVLYYLKIRRWYLQAPPHEADPLTDELAEAWVTFSDPPRRHKPQAIVRRVLGEAHPPLLVGLAVCRGLLVRAAGPFVGGSNTRAGTRSALSRNRDRDWPAPSFTWGAFDMQHDLLSLRCSAARRLCHKRGLVRSGSVALRSGRTGTHRCTGCRRVRPQAADNELPIAPGTIVSLSGPGALLSLRLWRDGQEDVIHFKEISLDVREFLRQAIFSTRQAPALPNDEILG